ncbi:uncharacterized protein LOC117166352 [Bombus vancouverensis nearcticus]|uniref:uncharacterized protein LOC117166352 n=1 Tax=Bombus vancouverensis nearcticus TaxID=2705178 RepID=UPI00402BA8E0
MEQRRNRQEYAHRTVHIALRARVSGDCYTENAATFSGAYEDWPGFADQFRCTIHENVRLDDCTRLMYLRSCLTQEAADSIATLANTASNYSVAWELLEKWYNQPTTIVNNHLKALFDASPLQRPSYQEIRAYLNQSEIKAHYKDLQALKQPTADTLLLYLLTSKLDPETEFRWKERIAHTPTYTRSTYQNPPRPTTYPEGSRVQNQDSKRSLTTNQTSVTQPQSPCNLCNGFHTPRNYRKFLSMSVPERENLAREKKICSNCLRSTHSAEECRSGSCMLCSKRHHTLLHANVDKPWQPIHTNLICLSARMSPTVLPTAIINIQDRTGNMQQCRVLLDSCSQAHLMTNEACQRLGLPTQRVDISLCGPNQVQS